MAALVGWLGQRQEAAVADLVEEYRILRGHVRGRLSLTDEERRRLARHGHRLGRRRLDEVATIVTPDTILRWHRQLIARKWTYAKRRGGRPRVLAEIRCLVVRMGRGEPHVGLQAAHEQPARSYNGPVLCPCHPALSSARTPSPPNSATAAWGHTRAWRRPSR
jgi:hypothetical protein